MCSKTLAVLLLCSMAHTVTADTYNAEIWADNWFEFRINGVKVAEDSVPITTERSFNAERFTFEATTPFTIGLIAKDFKENDTGLEYIGTRRQQMGDGGVIAQVNDEQGMPVALTDSSWRCMVTHEAPLSKDCEKEDNPIPGEGSSGFAEIEAPIGWDEMDFDDRGWANAQVYSEREVSPKHGYDEIRWQDAAELIWGPDLETNNTLVCRVTVRDN